MKQIMYRLKRNSRTNKKSCRNIRKRYDFLLGRMYFTGNDGYQNFLVFAPILSLLTLDSNKNVTYCMLTGYHLKK